VDTRRRLNAGVRMAKTHNGGYQMKEKLSIQIEITVRHPFGDNKTRGKAEITIEIPAEMIEGKHGAEQIAGMIGYATDNLAIIAIEEHQAIVALKAEEEGTK
jgi:hypothetical protein